MKEVDVRYAKPWWTSDSAEAIKQKRKAKNLFKRHPTETNFIGYKRKEAYANKIVKAAKTKSFKDFCSEMKSGSPIKIIWRKIPVSKKYRPQKPSIIFNQNLAVTKPNEKN